MVKRAKVKNKVLKTKLRIKKMKKYAKEFLKGRIGSGVCSCCKRERFGVVKFPETVKLTICIECVGRIYLRAKYMGKLPDLEGLDMAKFKINPISLQEFPAQTYLRKKAAKYIPTAEELKEMGGGTRAVVRRKKPKDTMFSWETTGAHEDQKNIETDEDELEGELETDEVEMDEELE